MNSYTRIHYIKTCLIIISLGIIILYLHSFYTDDGDILVNSHDNLDSNIAIYKLLSDTNTFYSPNDAIIENVMNGLPRTVFGSEYNVVSMLYYFFKPIDAYIINETLIRLIAFFGMYLLLRKYILNERDGSESVYLVASIALSLVFALLPYWSNAGASIAGQPFVLYAFLNIKRKEYRFLNWFILCFFPFYSDLIFAGKFVLFMLSAIWIYDWIKNRTINIYLLIAISVMSIIYLCLEYRLLAGYFDPQFVSHRQDFAARYLTFHESLTRGADLFFNGQYHAKSIHNYFLLPFIISGALALLISYKSNKIMAFVLSLFIVVSVFMMLNLFLEEGLISVRQYYVYFIDSVYKDYFIIFVVILTSIYLSAKEYILTYLLIAILSISLFSGFEDYQGTQIIKENISILNQIKFDRFYVLLPILWFLLFSLSSKIMLKKSGYNLLIIMVILFKHGEYSMSLAGHASAGKLVGMERYYSYDVYDEVKKYISDPVNTYRVMSISLPPSVAIYNGFYTLDAYLVNYPLDYKKQFRKIISAELDKSDEMKRKFDNWGSRCTLTTKDKDINLNLKQFKDMGGKYIFSRYEVVINNGVNVDFVRKFSSSNSLFDVYLYRVS